MRSRNVVTGWKPRRPAAGEPFDLAIPYLGLPGLDGLEVRRRIKAARPEASVMMLTARDSELDTVAGLDAGAIDYVAKPFRVAELLARVRAHTATWPVTRSWPEPCASTAARAAPGCRSKELDSSPREFDLLEHLVVNAGRIGQARATRGGGGGGGGGGGEKKKKKKKKRGGGGGGSLGSSPAAETRHDVVLRSTTRIPRMATLAAIRAAQIPVSGHAESSLSVKEVADRVDRGQAAGEDRHDQHQPDEHVADRRAGDLGVLLVSVGGLRCHRSPGPVIASRARISAHP